MQKINRVLMSVWDKRGLVEFAEELSRMGCEIISTGGTARNLLEKGIDVTAVEQVTGFPEILDGRVKTLHPFIHGAILAKRDSDHHLQQIEERSIKLIDMVVVNLYPFWDVVRSEGCTLQGALEQIDIGGPAMLRAAAKNYMWVVPVVDPSDYSTIIEQMRKDDRSIDEVTRFRLAKKTFSHTAWYDSEISNYLSKIDHSGKIKEPFPSRFNLNLKKIYDLRYGENPHQQAAFYGYFNMPDRGIARAELLHGKKLSYNNILDSESALMLLREFDEPATIIIKHNNPCGVARGVEGSDFDDVCRRALQCDPVSSFGGIVAVNRKLTPSAADLLKKIFLEVIIATEYEDEALKLLKEKKDLRLLRVGSDELSNRLEGYHIKSVSGGVLVQHWDETNEVTNQMRVVTEKMPTQDELDAMSLAYRICKHVTSNSIVISSRDQMLGVGAGQQSRVDAMRVARMKFMNLPAELRGKKPIVVASDAFFPFSDCIDICAEMGVSAIVQPGGSVRDSEVIDACNRHGIAMVMSGVRHFKH